jgi:hypothetical protein
LLKFLKRIKLVCDARELETEVVGAIGVRRFFAKVVEKFLLLFVDHAIVVGEMIYGWCSSQYSMRKMSVVRNIPDKLVLDQPLIVNLKCKFSIAENDVLFLSEEVRNNGGV